MHRDEREGAVGALSSFQVVNVCTTHRPGVVGDGNPILQCLLESRPSPITLRKCIEFDGVRFVEFPDLPPSFVHEFTRSGFSRALNHFVHKDGGDCSTHLTVYRVRRFRTRFESEKEHGDSLLNRFTLFTTEVSPRPHRTGNHANEQHDAVDNGRHVSCIAVSTDGQEEKNCSEEQQHDYRDDRQRSH